MEYLPTFTTNLGKNSSPMEQLGLFGILIYKLTSCFPPVTCGRQGVLRNSEKSRRSQTTGKTGNVWEVGINGEMRTLVVNSVNWLFVYKVGPPTI